MMTGGLVITAITLVLLPFAPLYDNTYWMLHACVVQPYDRAGNRDVWGRATRRWLLRHPLLASPAAIDELRHSRCEAPAKLVATRHRATRTLRPRRSVTAFIVKMLLRIYVPRVEIVVRPA